MDFHSENWDDVYPLDFMYMHMEIIATMSEKLSAPGKWRVGLSYRLKPPMLRHLKIQVCSDASHEQSLKYPHDCFLNRGLSQ